MTSTKRKPKRNRDIPVSNAWGRSRWISGNRLSPQNITSFGYHNDANIIYGRENLIARRRLIVIWAFLYAKRLPTGPQWESKREKRRTTQSAQCPLSPTRYDRSGEKSTASPQHIAAYGIMEGKALYVDTNAKNPNRY